MDLDKKNQEQSINWLSIAFQIITQNQNQSWTCQGLNSKILSVFEEISHSYKTLQDSRSTSFLVVFDTLKEPQDDK